MTTYTHSSKNYSRTKEEKRQEKADLKLYKEEIKKSILTSESDCDTIARALLDSSLISQTRAKKYQVKVIECGNYFQVYDYNYLKIKKNKSLKLKKEYFSRKNKKQLSVLDNCVNDKWGRHTTLFEVGALKLYNTSPGLCSIIKIMKMPVRSRGDPSKDKLTIDLKNINRSRNSIQRLIKSNETKFKTFVTLTFAENVKSIEEANKKFNVWRTYIKRLKSDFAYVGVPEFQKRGAVHYHLLTNIDYNDYSLLSKELVITYSKKSHSYDKGRTIKGWKYGYTKVKSMDNVNVVGYLTKYLVKDLDNRLWGKRRYFYSQNLIKPKEILIDLSDMKDFTLYMDILDFHKEYEGMYADKLGQVINFMEYKKEDDLI